MKSQVYAVFDKKAEVSMRPFFFNSDAEAMRSFVHAVGGADSKLSEYPEDFGLFRVGTWNDHTMALEPEEHGVCKVMDGLSAYRLGREREESFKAMQESDSHEKM